MFPDIQIPLQKNKKMTELDIVEKKKRNFLVIQQFHYTKDSRGRP